VEFLGGLGGWVGGGVGFRGGEGGGKVKRVVRVRGRGRVIGDVGRKVEGRTRFGIREKGLGRNYARARESRSMGAVGRRMERYGWRLERYGWRLVRVWARSWSEDRVSWAWIELRGAGGAWDRRGVGWEGSGEDGSKGKARGGYNGWTEGRNNKKNT